MNDLRAEDEIGCAGLRIPIATLTASSGTLALPWPGSNENTNEWFVARCATSRVDSVYAADQANNANSWQARVLGQATPFYALSTENTPPVSPTTGDRHLVGTSPIDDFVGLANKVVEYRSGGWVPTTPRIGDFLHDIETSLLLMWNGTTWGPSGSLTFVDVAGDTMTGVLAFSGTGHAGLRLNNLTSVQRDAIVSPGAGALIWNTTTEKVEVRGASAWAAVGTGDVVGPASATDNAIARFDLTTGKLLQNSGATIDDNGNLTAGPTLKALRGSAGDVMLSLFQTGVMDWQIVNRGTTGLLDFTTGSITPLSLHPSTGIAMFSSGVNIGTGTADNPFVMEKSQNSSLWARFRNPNVGALATVGLLFGGDGSAAQASIFVNSSSKTDFGGANSINIGNYGAAGLGFFTNNTYRGGFAADGTLTINNNVGIGTAAVGNRALKMGAGTGVAIAELNGGNGTNGGSAVFLNANSGNIGGFGNWSSIVGGAYDASIMFYAVGDLVFAAGGATQRVRIDSTGKIRIGAAAAAGATVDAGVGTVSQTSAVFSARGIPNAFEWGHQNGAGYANTFGFQSSSGRPYIVFNGEAGSTVINTIRTRGVKARGLIGDNAGGLSFFTVASANADDQTVVEDAKLTSLGYLGIAGSNSPAAPLQIASSSARVTPGGGYLVQSFGGGNSYWLLNAATNFNSAIHFGDPDSNTVGRIEYIHNGDRMEFHTAGAERMRITSGGNLLIGGTTNGGERVTITAPVGGYGYIITDNTYATNCIRFSVAYGVEMGNIGGSPMHLITNNTARISMMADGKVGISTVNPAAVFDVNGDVAHRMAALTLANSANHNVSRPAFSSLRIAGPTAAFQITGLTGGADGIEAELINTTAHQMTLDNESASSTAGNRIVTDTGGNLNCKHAILRYDATSTRWRVISYRT